MGTWQHVTAGASRCRLASQMRPGRLPRPCASRSRRHVQRAGTASERCSQGLDTLPAPFLPSRTRARAHGLGRRIWDRIWAGSPRASQPARRTAEPSAIAPPARQDAAVHALGGLVGGGFRALGGNTGLDDAKDDGGGYGEEGLPGHDKIQSVGEWGCLRVTTPPVSHWPLCVRGRGTRSVSNAALTAASASGNKPMRARTRWLLEPFP